MVHYTHNLDHISRHYPLSLFHSRLSILTGKLLKPEEDFMAQINQNNKKCRSRLGFDMETPTKYALFEFNISAGIIGHLAPFRVTSLFSSNGF